MRVARHLFPAGVTSGVHATAGRRESGVAMLPGELFGYDLNGPQRWLTLRGSLAVSPDDLLVCVHRLREAALLLRGSHGPRHRGPRADQSPWDRRPGPDRDPATLLNLSARRALDCQRASLGSRI